MSITLDDNNDTSLIDRISDDVFVLSKEIILKFNVSLSKISGENRYLGHKEYMYKNKNTKKPIISIKRSFDYYLSFESLKSDYDNKLFIRISAQDYIAFMRIMDEAKDWLFDQKYENLFMRSAGKLILTSPVPIVKMPNLPMGKYIELMPTIIDKGIANADKEQGIKMEFGSSDHVAYLTVERFMGLYYIMSSFNMYQAAITLLNYMAPPFGTNRTVLESTFENIYKEEPPMDATKGINGRQITPKGVKNNISLLEG